MERYETVKQEKSFKDDYLHGWTEIHVVDIRLDSKAANRWHRCFNTRRISVAYAPIT